jgi:AcrR family transcriptional regulator
MISTEDRILRAATGVFAKRGVSGATTREIARRARVNEVTVFRHFRNKDELLRRVIVCSGQRFEDVFAAAPLRTAADFRRTVETYAKVYTRKLVENEEFIRTFMGELTRHLELCRRLFAEGGKPARQKFIAYLRAARRRGLVRAGVDPTMAADALSAMLLGGVLRRPLTSAQYDIDAYARTCVKLYLKGVQA